MKKIKKKNFHQETPREEVDDQLVNQTAKFSVTEKAHVDDWTKIFLTWVFVVLILLFVIMDELLLAGLIALIGLTVAILSTAPAQKLTYSFDRKGFTRNNHNWLWHEFRSFTITVTPKDVKINLWPIQRFQLPVILHTPYSQASKIINHISYHLPQQKGVGETLTDLFLRVTRL